MPANDSDENMHAFVDRHGLHDMIHVVDDGGDIWARYGIAYQPAWVFITPAGEVDVVAGAIDAGLADRLDAFLERG